MTVQLYGHQVTDLYAAAVGETARCTHFIVGVHIATKVVDYTWSARPERDALVFAAVQRNLRGDAYRIEVRPVNPERRWWWEKP